MARANQFLPILSTDEEPPFPELGKCYECLLAYDAEGERMILLDYPPEVDTYLKIICGGGPAEDFMEHLGAKAQTGIYRCLFKFQASTNWEGGDDVDMVLVVAAREVHASPPRRKG